MLSATTKSLLLNVIFIYSTLLFLCSFTGPPSSGFAWFSLGDLILDTKSNEWMLVILEVSNFSVDLFGDFTFYEGEIIRITYFSNCLSGETRCS